MLSSLKSKETLHLYHLIRLFHYNFKTKPTNTYLWYAYENNELAKHLLVVCLHEEQKAACDLAVAWLHSFKKQQLYHKKVHFVLTKHG